MDFDSMSSGSTPLGVAKCGCDVIGSMTVSKTVRLGSSPSTYAIYAMAVQYEDAEDNNVFPQLTLTNGKYCWVGNRLRLTLV